MARRREDDGPGEQREGLLSWRNVLAVGIGMVAGSWIARNQREIVKTTVKGSITAGRKIREVAAEVTEEIEGSVAEAVVESGSPGERQ